MGKKKFIDKKKSATFCLLARDSSDPIYVEEPENDRVFVRVDNNPVSISGIDEGQEGPSDGNDPDSIFADAPDDVDYDGFSGHSRGPGRSVDVPVALPVNVRREILELGFPDDGYNYLLHMREIRNTGGGSAYFHNHKANLHDIPDDVKAYDASRVRVSQAVEETVPATLYKVAEKSVNVRVQRVVDPEVAKLLDEVESNYGSDIDDLEEDFVVQANLPGEGDDVYSEKISTSVSNSQDEILYESNSDMRHGIDTEIACNSIGEVGGDVIEKPRVQRLLDQQFDMLEHQEYGTDSDDEYDDIVAEEDTSLAEKLNNVLKNHKIDDADLYENYKAPADILHDKEGINDGELVSSAAEIVRRCTEYAEKYETEDADAKEVVIVEESSDESEIWDCETIVSTYSNLDNHPGRIGAPAIARKKRLADTIAGALNTGNNNMISLGGREKLPVDYLPNGRKVTKEKVKPVTKTEVPVRKPHGQESKEEKKERKAAVKEERREARRVKKAMKELYTDEAKRAQKVAAISGPSSFHLM